MNATNDAERFSLALAVYRNDSGWTTYVLKRNHGKNKPMLETARINPYASAFCAVISPLTMGSFDYGDTYLTQFIHDTCIKEETNEAQ
jgi:hypothetical protein